MFGWTLTGTFLTPWSHNEFGKDSSPGRKNHVMNFRALRGWALLYYPVAEPLATCGYWHFICGESNWDCRSKKQTGFWGFCLKKKEYLILKCWLHVVKVIQLCPTLCNPHGLYSPWYSPGQNTGVGSLSLLQGIFPTQELNREDSRRILYQLSYVEIFLDMLG